MTEDEILKIAESKARPGEYVESVVYHAIYHDGAGKVRTVMANGYSKCPAFNSPLTYPQIDYTERG
jgi:hypothetical protein